MEKQLIISISREYGSGGHKIAQELATRLGFPIYDRNLLDAVIAEKNLTGTELKKYDEAPRNLLLSRSVRGYSNSPEEVAARMQFDFLKEKAESGESFVVVGRCSEDVLKAYDGLMSFFIIGDEEVKIKRIQESHGVSDEEAVMIMRRHDKKRKAYHNYYCQTKWGDARNYDMTINSSRLGIEATADVIADYIKAAQAKEQ